MCIRDSERMTHAFVRGLWRREDETNPMILSKACHDLDLMVWLSGRHCLEMCIRDRYWDMLIIQLLMEKLKSGVCFGFCGI